MTPISVRPVGAVLVTLLLSGCGGSSSDPGSYEELLDTTQALSDRLTGASPTVAMPQTGTASYRGGTAFAAGNIEDADYILDNASLVSDLELTVDFQSDGISGNMTNFESRDGRPVTGSVAIYNGSIMNDNEMIANFDGQSLLIDGEPIGFAEDGFMIGGFFEPEAGIVGGGLATTGYTGVFVAEKQ